MKKAVTYVFIVCVLLAIGLWRLRSRNPVLIVEQPVTNSIAATESAMTASAPPPLTSQPSTNKARSLEEMLARMSPEQQSNLAADYREKIEVANWQWKTPINFYGKVVDESDQPVEGASIDFTWTDLSPTGTSKYHTTSDYLGLFSMLNKNGKRLSVTAAKPGYYSARDARLASFEYSYPPEEAFKPDPNNPIVLHLRKKGPGTDLITSQYGVADNFAFSVGGNIASTSVDFLHRKTGTDGQLKISQRKPEYKSWQQATEWSFKIEIPDGGFVEENDEFPFDAPETGYQSVLEFQFEKGQTNWTEHLQKDFYIRFGNPPLYGQLHLETSINTGVPQSHARVD